MTSPQGIVEGSGCTLGFWGYKERHRPTPVHCACVQGGPPMHCGYGEGGHGHPSWILGALAVAQCIVGVRGIQACPSASWWGIGRVWLPPSALWVPPAERDLPEAKAAGEATAAQGEAADS